MVFSSLEFLFRFLPIFLILYFIAKPKYRNYVLLVGSLIFYAYGEPIYILLMIASLCVNHFCARRITEGVNSSEEKGANCKFWLVTSLIFNLGALFFFKYFNFFLRILDGIIPGVSLPQVDISLPLGISFYTFQIMSYVIDVYRGHYEARGRIINFATYVSMFPQLIAGPIVNYSEVEHELTHRTVNFDELERGASIFIVGLAYKVLLANKIASLWTAVEKVGVLGINTPIAWLGAWGYSMQLFFDFFGYSLMAIGLGYILGFHFPDNFLNPYCATSATDFWRKWHVTLGRWFRNYVYIPLGGNRKGKNRTVFNLFVVWALTGLWHGADWNFVIWGLFFFVILTLEKNFYLDFLERHKIIGHVYTLMLIPISWTIFHITDLTTLKLYFYKMFFIPVEGSVAVNGMKMFCSMAGTYWWLFAICAICATPLPLKLVKKHYNHIICKVVLFAVFWYSVYQIAQGGANPFLYFRF